jgi:2-succinyl-6-hydroxy-2,4-cyclohexadiene-1-carboxylate synthase
LAQAFALAVEGATLAGERSGTGTPLVLVHGMAGCRGDWDRLVAALPAGFGTVRYDLRGFGQSTVEQDLPYSHASDLLVLFDTLKIERAPVLGLSMGGAVALNFALNHPERVSRLTLMSPAMVGWEWSEEWKALWRSVTSPARDGDLALARERWWQHPMFAAVRESDAANELRRAIDAYHGRQWIRDAQRSELPDADRLHTLAMPTLLLTGERDFPDLRLIADVIEGAAPHVTRIDFAGAGHMIHLERPAGVAAAILS